MRAVVIEDSDRGSRLAMRTVPEPTVGSTDVLVRVETAGLNRADLRRATSHFAGSERRSGAVVGGLEMAGEVIGVGDGVTGFSVGDRVMAMTGAAWAELVGVDHRLTLPVPRDLPWPEAAAVPISFVTAHDALATAGGLTRGQSVLVQGATTAAGIAVSQVARLLGAEPVIGTTRAAEKLEFLKELGCHVALATTDGGISETVRRLTGDRGADLVIDIVGGEAVAENIDAVAVLGRIVCVGRVGGTDARLNLDEFARKRVTMIGVTFRTRSLEERASVVSKFRHELLPCFGTGALRPVIDSVFALDEIEEAQERMRTDRHRGKIIVRVR